MFKVGDYIGCICCQIEGTIIEVNDGGHYYLDIGTAIMFDQAYAAKPLKALDPFIVKIAVNRPEIV